MTYSSLTANIDIMRNGNEDLLDPTKYSDDALLSLYKDASKIEMKLDLEAALQIAYDDTTTLDEVVDKNQVRLSRALSYKQLCSYYQRNDTGTDTKNRKRWDIYRALYEQDKSMFGIMASGTPVTSVSSQPFKR